MKKYFAVGKCFKIDVVSEISRAQNLEEAIAVTSIVYSHWTKLRIDEVNFSDQRITTVWTNAQ